MLRKLSDEIRYCYERAEACLRKAQESVSKEQRESYAQIAKNWINLARSYEFSERILDFTNENDRRRKAERKPDPSLH